jgi:hypothetical protein
VKLVVVYSREGVMLCFAPHDLGTGTQAAQEIKLNDLNGVGIVCLFNKSYLVINSSLRLSESYLK